MVFGDYSNSILIVFSLQLFPGMLLSRTTIQNDASGSSTSNSIMDIIQTRRMSEPRRRDLELGAPEAVAPTDRDGRRIGALTSSNTGVRRRNGLVLTTSCLHDVHSYRRYCTTNGDFGRRLPGHVTPLARWRKANGVTSSCRR